MGSDGQLLFVNTSAPRWAIELDAEWNVVAESDPTTDIGKPGL